LSAAFEREQILLRDRVVRLSRIVEGQFSAAVRAFLAVDAGLAAEVEASDEEIDRDEIDVEEECLKMLALYQPFARDLRYVITMLKINQDLETIGDMCVNIARKARGLAPPLPEDLCGQLKAMAEQTRRMLAASIKSLAKLDLAEAAAIRPWDDEIDRMKADLRKAVEERVRASPGEVSTLLRILAVGRNLERVADVAASIADGVVYLIDGRIVRHPDAGGRRGERMKDEG
jgi:phosphate transport system protein